MRCADCGALNADTAAWCSQCYRSFTEPPSDEPPSEVVTEGRELWIEVAAVEAETPPAERLVAPAGDEDPDPGDRRLRRSDEGVDWRCGSCETWNPIERSTCAVCGAALADSFGGSSGEDLRTDVDPAKVVIASVLLPGAGHVLLGRSGTGFGRMLLYVVWAVGGVLLLQAASDSDGSVLPALPLLTGALVLLATSVLDAVALRRGDTRTELLSARSLLWLTVSVIGLTTLALIASALSVSA